MKLTNEQIKAKYPETAERIIGERRVIRKLVTEAIGDGNTVSVYDGGEWVIRRSQSVSMVMDEIMGTDQDIIHIHGLDERVHKATFWLVYGNSPEEVIADHSDNLYGHQLYRKAYRKGDPDE